MKTRIVTLSGGLLVVALATGCTITPVGPFAESIKRTTAANPIDTAAAKPGKSAKVEPMVSASQDIVAMPTITEAPPPPRPAYFVGPDDVNEMNAADVAKKLSEEIESDKRDARQMKPLPEVSVIKGRR